MAISKLRVFPAEGVLVTNYEALDVGAAARRFVGRTFDASTSSWPAKAEPEVLSPSCTAHFNEYVGAIKRGELVPADAVTAAIAGVPFKS